MKIIEVGLPPARIVAYRFHPGGEIISLPDGSRITDVVWLFFGRTGHGYGRITRREDGGLAFENEPHDRVREAHRACIGDTCQIVGDMELWEAFTKGGELACRYEGFAFDAFS